MFWKKFPDKKPKKDGWYQCTIAFPFTKLPDGTDVYQTYVMDLHYCTETEQFIDNRERHVFHLYDVYGYGKGNQKVKLKSYEHGDKTEYVVAWKHMPKPYLSKGRRYYHETNSTRNS